MAEVDVRRGGVKSGFYDERLIILDRALKLLFEFTGLYDLDGAALDELELFSYVFFHDVGILQGGNGIVN